MRDETKPWLAKADENLDTAEYMFKGARYAPTCFMCQQTLEVLLKAAIIELAGKRHPKIHDLDKLFFEAGLPELKKYETTLGQISKHYYQVRYPDFVQSKYNRRVAEDALTKTREIFIWLKKKILAK